MKPRKFEDLVNRQGKLEKYKAGQIFHAQDFPDKLFLLRSGYVKRYQARKFDEKVLELIYGPGHIISLSQLYKTLFAVDQNQDRFIYVYQAMTDVEMSSIGADAVIQELETDPELYRDFFYESGIKLRSNIFRLASNSIKEPQMKVAHQLVSLAYEFADITPGDTQRSAQLPLPQSAVDIAEQLNISKVDATAALKDLSDKSLIKVEGDKITILDIQMLKDVYL